MKSIGALVRFELRKEGLSIAEQHLLIGGVLKFAERQLWAKGLYQIKNLVITNTDQGMKITFDVFIALITFEDDYVAWFDKFLDEYRKRNFPPGYCPVSTDFTWKWDKVSRISDIGDGGKTVFVFQKPNTDSGVRCVVGFRSSGL